MRPLETLEDRHWTEYLLNRREVWRLLEVAPPEPWPKLLAKQVARYETSGRANSRRSFADRELVANFEYASPVCDISFFQALDWQIEAAAQAKAVGDHVERIGDLLGDHFSIQRSANSISELRGRPPHTTS